MRKILWIVLGSALVIVMVATGALIIFNPASTRGAEKLGYGQTIQVDDFAFAALSSERATQIGNETAQGIFYIVPFQVLNRAKRVTFQFRPEMAILVDEAGQEFMPAANARRAWFEANGKGDACAAEIAAGTACETVLVYDVPANTQAPILKISFAGRIGEIADAFLYGNRVIQLK